MDVHGDFLQGGLHEIVYMTLSDEFDSQEKRRKYTGFLNPYMGSNKPYDNRMQNSQHLFKQVSPNPSMIFLCLRKVKMGRLLFFE